VRCLRARPPGSSCGHGLDYVTAEKIAGLSEIVRTEYLLLHDGGVRCSSARETVRAMRAAMDRGRKILASEIPSKRILRARHDHRHRSDLIDIRRVAKVIERHGDRFLDRIFTEAERARAARRAKSEKMVVATYAKRFAANGSLFQGARHRHPAWRLGGRDMGVVNCRVAVPTIAAGRRSFWPGWRR